MLVVLFLLLLVVVLCRCCFVNSGVVSVGVYGDVVAFRIAVMFAL